MTISAANLRLLAVALCACAGGVFAAETGATSAKPAEAKPVSAKTAEAKPAASSVTKENAKKEAETKANQQSMMEQFKAQADSFSKEHDALLKELNSASEDQRKAILDKMAERKKDFEAKLNAMHKQMRDEQRKQRQNTASKKP
jgi:hypothetical protein